MRKGNTIIIDLDKYCTQQQFAKDNDIKLNTLSQRIKRIKAGQQAPFVDFIEIPELNNLVLVNKLTK